MAPRNTRYATITNQRKSVSVRRASHHAHHAPQILWPQIGTRGQHHREKHQPHFRACFGEMIGALIVQPQRHDRHERRDRDRQICAHHSGQMQIVDLLRRALKRLDGREINRANVKPNDCQDREPEKPIEDGFGLNRRRM